MGIKFDKQFTDMVYGNIYAVNDYFIHEYWRKTADEIGLSLKAALEYRLKSPAFIIDVLRGGKICQNWALQEAVSYMGCMAICTDTRQAEC